MQRRRHDRRRRLRRLKVAERRSRQARPVGKIGKPGKKAFKGQAPAGYRIRMMEPGEAEPLLAVERSGRRLLIEAGHAELAASNEPPLCEFVRFLLAHEVFVAISKASQAPVGFAAAAARLDLYWLAEMVVDPAHGQRGVGAALLRAVTERARWFFHRALGLSTYVDIPFNAPFYERNGFMKIARDDLNEELTERLAAECPRGSDVRDRVVMVKWL